MSGRRCRRSRDEAGVFVPALMGAGILASAAVLAVDAVRRAFPATGRRWRLRADAVAVGRERDLLAATRAEPPQPVRFQRIAREGRRIFVTGVVLVGLALALARLVVLTYGARTGVLAGRGWTLSVGLGAAAVIGTVGVGWCCSALGSRTRLAVAPMVGVLELHPDDRAWIGAEGGNTKEDGP